MSGTTDIAFPAITEAELGGTLVNTANARDLHASLEVGRVFAAWIKGRIAEYGFVQGVDYEVFSETGKNPLGGRAAKEYALTLDMAKELAMVENNERGRQVRRYFLQCEKMARAKAGAIDMNAVGGMMKSIMAKQLREVVPALVAAEIASQSYMLRRGKTAGQIWAAHGLPPMKGMAAWFGNRLAKVGCQIEGNGCGELGLMKARLFDPDKADLWMRNGGRLMVEQKLLERRGQTTLRLMPAPSRPATESHVSA